MAQSRYRIGFDIGGTFTDFVLFDAERNRIIPHKHLTTPDDPARGALRGLVELVDLAGISLADVSELVHGTTLVTNAVIERRGARLGLLTTAGMRDVLELGYEQRYEIYDLFLKFAEPLVRRRHRIGVPERLSAAGEVIVPLDEGAVRQAARRLATDGIEAIAICFLHAYRDGTHERRAAEIVHEECPTLAVSISSDVNPELREYPRFVTTCANAYVQPLIVRYLDSLLRELNGRGFGGTLHLMHSGGGLLSPEIAARFPIRLLESGPAGGGLATAFFGALSGKSDVVAFDMGGTTAKTCLVEDGAIEIAPMMEAAREHRFSKGSGLPIRAPVIDMIEIGAGGGSIAAIDDVGLLQVGPRSASAVPGPACYGQGGKEPTVTDANLVLGYYDPAFFLGGRMALDVAAAERALATVAGPLGLSVVEAAYGVSRIVVESMASSARIHLVEKGKDPRRYSIVGFGGAGPAHVVELARLLGAREVIVPPVSGAASALGFLAAPLSFEQARSHPAVLEDMTDYSALNGVLAELEQQCRTHLLANATTTGDIVVERYAEMRLLGQMHEISVPLPAGSLGKKSYALVRSAFTKAYTARYTKLYERAKLEIVAVRVRCKGPVSALSIAQALPQDGASAIKGTRRAYFRGAFSEATVYDRYRLKAGDAIAGPAIIEERESTTILPPGDSLMVDASGCLRISVTATVKAEDLIEEGLPVEDAMRKLEADPIGLEIMWSRLINVTQEMWSTVTRTAFSLSMSESQDFACDLLDAEGNTLAHSPQAMPLFALTIPSAVKYVLSRFPADKLRPGDVIITNDPWHCAGHLNDFAVVTPIFRNKQLIAFAGAIGHVSEIGGTKELLQARELYEEGLQVPAMKLYREGVLNEDLIALIEENVRDPAQMIGDLHALAGANARGEERLLAFLDEFGIEDLRALGRIVQGRSEKAMREAVSDFPDGEYQTEVWANPLGTPIRLPAKVIVRGDSIVVDYEGVQGQVPIGGVNVPLNYSSAYSTYPLKCIMTPNVRGNAGCYVPFQVKAPEGSILNARKPAAVAIRHRLGWYTPTCVLNALAEGAPERIRAYSGLPSVIYWYSIDGNGRTYSDITFAGGGQGASLESDGKSGLLWPTSAAATSIELLESRVPVLVEEKEFVADSGGAGTTRGGLGVRFRCRKLRGYSFGLRVSVFTEGYDVEQPGLFGGRSGKTPEGALLGADGTRVSCGASSVVNLDSADQSVEFHLAGGAGFGDPLRRSNDRIENDILDGYVTRRGAARDYAWREPGIREEPGSAGAGIPAVQH